MQTEKIPLRASEWSRAEARLESDRKRDLQRDNLPPGKATLGARAQNGVFARDLAKRILPACRTMSLSTFSRTSQALKSLVFPNTTGPEIWCPSTRRSSMIQTAVFLLPRRLTDRVIN